MTQLFRSKSWGFGTRTTDLESVPTSPSLYHYQADGEEEDDDDDDDEYEDEEEEYDEEYCLNPISTPLIVPDDSRERKKRERQQNHQQFQILAIFVSALRKSVATCGVEKDDICSIDISPPTNVKHVSHVTFDRFSGFLGLPVEFKTKILSRVPSASSSVFGVSAESMKCSYDNKGNSVPTILLMMQRRLYLEGGLQTEGIFRINPENSQEEYVRDQLNRGIVANGIDVHCLAGLIKAWFRELPSGVLDSLAPDQVMNCNTEADCVRLMMLLKPTEAALLDWAINLMTDVVQNESQNKMNARNIAMVFAPNMTQMADPLTALIHAVQVMNFLKTLIIKTIREREKSGAELKELPCSSTSPHDTNDPNPPLLGNENCEGFSECTITEGVHETPNSDNILKISTRNESEGTEIINDDRERPKPVSDSSKPIKCESGATENEFRDAESFLDRLSLRRGVMKLRNHPVFQLTRSAKKPAEVDM